jgi:Rv0078B-related antitoxin
MTPEAALEVQIERYRNMTGEERLAIALRLHELSCEVAREGIRAQFPGASAEEVERKLGERIRLSYEL